VAAVAPARSPSSARKKIMADVVILGLCSCLRLILADAVEKVGGMPPARNKRIASADFLNQYCVFGARLESMLLGDPLQNPFSTVSATSSRSVVELRLA
jgi:hypothetical protein